jgi:hypothetical protein
MNQIPRGGKPSPGDVLITVQLGQYLVSIVPHPPRLRFKEWADAVAIAMDWATVNYCSVWRWKDDDVTMLYDKNASPMTKRKRQIEKSDSQQPRGRWASHR